MRIYFTEKEMLLLITVLEDWIDTVLPENIDYEKTEKLLNKLKIQQLQNKDSE